MTTTVKDSQLQNDQSQNVSSILFLLLLTERTKQKQCAIVEIVQIPCKKKINISVNQKLVSGFLNYGCSASVSENFWKYWNDETCTFLNPNSTWTDCKLNEWEECAVALSKLSVYWRHLSQVRIVTNYFRTFHHWYVKHNLKHYCQEN